MEQALGLIPSTTGKKKEKKDGKKWIRNAPLIEYNKI
jgi:hypothetical protein